MATPDSPDSDAIQNANNGNNKSPDPLKGLHGFKSRRRSLDIEIVNRTGSLMRLLGEDFRFGTWYVSPDPVNIGPGETCLAYVCSRLISIVGVAGGLVYELAGTGKCLYIGFDNPVIGSMKTFIELGTSGRSARWASSQAKTGSVKNISIDGYEVIAVIKPPRQSPFRLMQYTVKQIT